MIERKIRLYMLETGKKQKITPIIQQNDYQIHVRKQHQQLPQHVEAAVQAHWDDYAQHNNRLAHDGQTYFFTSFNQTEGIDYVTPNAFRYVEAFGRSFNFDHLKVEVAAQSFTALSSICLVETCDGQLLFGIKQNMDNKISGFSGYLSAPFIEENHVNLYGYLVDSICKELPLEPQHIQTITRIGQAYSPDITGSDGRLNNKVYNNQFVITLHLTADEVLTRFQPNLQFSSIYAVPMEKEIIQQHIVKHEKQMSSHFLAALLNLFGLQHLPLHGHTVHHAQKSGRMTTVEWIKQEKIYQWGLIGSKQIKHYSVAPAMWRALFSALNYPVHYFTIAEDEQTFVAQQLNNVLQSGSFIGCNIALPWKEWVKSAYAPKTTLPVANTLLCAHGQLQVFNTDGIGIIQAIEKFCTLQHKIVLLMGAGGAAQTVPQQLFRSGIRELFICDKEPKKMVHLARTANAQGISLVHVEEIAAIFPKVDVIIQATPCGMKGIPEQTAIPFTLLPSLKRGAVIAEMVFNPEETPLLTYAKSLGYKTITGKHMLVEQAAASFDEAFGRALTQQEKKIMEEAVTAALIE